MSQTQSDNSILSNVKIVNRQHHTKDTQGEGFQ